MNPAILKPTSQIPADGWHQIEVPGEHINHGAQVVQVIDAKALTSILDQFSTDAAEVNFPGLLVDRDHFSLDAEKPSEAMGWVTELRNRAGIMEARIDWTSVGRPLVEGKAYKFLSTVYEPADVEKIGTRGVNGATYQLVRPLHLRRLALTNDPNSDGGEPLSNRRPPSTSTDGNAAVLRSLREKLGLSPDASEAAVASGLHDIRARADTCDRLRAECDELRTVKTEAEGRALARSYRVSNRAQELKRLVPVRSWSACWEQAVRETTAV